MAVPTRGPFSKWRCEKYSVYVWNNIDFVFILKFLHIASPPNGSRLQGTGSNYCCVIISRPNGKCSGLIMGWKMFFHQSAFTQPRPLCHTILLLPDNLRLVGELLRPGLNSACSLPGNQSRATDPGSTCYARASPSHSSARLNTRLTVRLRMCAGSCGLSRQSPLWSGQGFDFSLFNQFVLKPSFRWAHSIFMLAIWGLEVLFIHFCFG